MKREEVNNVSFLFFKRKILFFLILMSFFKNIIAEEKNETFQFFKDETTHIKNPFELRDPFRRQRFSRKRTKKGEFAKGKNLFSNQVNIDDLKLNDLIIVGILLGNERRAMARLSSNKKGDVFILKEGMKIGENEAEIKAIMPGGIVLVEKIRNIYDQDEYIETIIPISEE